MQALIPVAKCDMSFGTVDSFFKSGWNGNLSKHHSTKMGLVWPYVISDVIEKKKSSKPAH